MTRHDHRIWTWLTKAGLRLTTSELIRLEEQQTLPEPELLGEAGRQELTNLIYSADTICDRLLDVSARGLPLRTGRLRLSVRG